MEVEIDLTIPSRAAVAEMFLSELVPCFENPKHILFDTESLIEGYVYAWVRLNRFVDTWEDERLQFIEPFFAEYAKNNFSSIMLYEN